MQELNFEQKLDRVLALDSRFHREAYLFLREALDHTQRKLDPASKRNLKQIAGQFRHVSGQELLAGIREYALLQFGPMAQMVLEEWGVRKCADFGDIVFNMVEMGLLAKTEQDCREDFQPGYDFHDAFRKPFLPAAKSSAIAEATKATEA